MHSLYPTLQAYNKYGMLRNGVREHKQVELKLKLEHTKIASQRRYRLNDKSENERKTGTRQQKLHMVANKVFARKLYVCSR
jgi:hypothetical protein